MLTSYNYTNKLSILTYIIHSSRAITIQPYAQHLDKNAWLFFVFKPVTEYTEYGEYPK